MKFEFATAGKILFGAGTRKTIGSILAEMGRRMLLVSGLSPGSDANHELKSIIESSGLKVDFFYVEGEPTVESVQQGVELAKSFGCDVIAGLGGGSAIDGGKAIAALVTNSGQVMDYLEVIGSGKSLTAAPLPYVAVPTTAGTGAEVTRNAVLGSKGQRMKVSLRSPWMLPKAAIVDPELTYSLPAAVTAYTGMDALTQLIEPFVCNASSPLTDAVCREGIIRASRSLRSAYYQANDAAAREDMSLASLLGGIALANARLGAVHGFASPLGGMYTAPHGAICARLLPVVVETNLGAMREREPENPALARYGEIARCLTGDAEALPEQAVEWLYRLVQELEIPALSSYGLDPREIDLVVEKASQASSMKGNPIRLTPGELKRVLEQAL